MKEEVNVMGWSCEELEDGKWRMDMIQMQWINAWHFQKLNKEKMKMKIVFLERNFLSKNFIWAFPHHVTAVFKLYMAIQVGCLIGNWNAIWGHNKKETQLSLQP